MPVIIRSRRTTGERGENNKIAALAEAAITAHMANIMRGGNRSARLNNALAKVPKTKPAATLLDKSDAWKSLI